MKIIVYPFDTNPYISFLYKNLNKYDIKVKFIKSKFNFKTVNLLYFYVEVFLERINGSYLFHLHWVNFNFPFNNIFTRILTTINTIFSLLWIKLLCYKLVWTVHNIVPHEKQTLNDEYITQLVIKLADKIIVHSSETVKDVVYYGGNIDKCIVIPIGNYNIYENNLSKKKARKILNLNEDDFVFLFQGFIRKYKGILELLMSFEKICKEYNNVKLIVAGNIFDKSIEKEIIKYKNILGNKLILKITYIPDNDLQIYYNASNVAVFPFKKLTTSSSVLTAFSFSKPIIAPRLGNIKDFPESLGYFYELDEQLINKMKEAINDKKITRKVTEINKFNLKYSWINTAYKTFQVYKEIINLN